MTGRSAMIRRTVVFGAVLLLAVSVCMGESMRTTLTKENKFPEQSQLELGLLLQYREAPEESNESVVDFSGPQATIPQSPRDEYTYTPYARYGLTDRLAVYGKVPFVMIDRDSGSSDSGLGDMALGFEMLAWEDIFDYPWVIPHGELSLETGDEDQGLGSGETSFTFGLAVGTITYDILHWIADARYSVRTDSDNMFSLSGALILDVSEQLSIVAEGMGTDEEREPGREHPMFFQGGLCYKPLENLAISVYGGGAKNAEHDAMVSGKLAYSF